MSVATTPLPRLGIFVSRFPPPVGFMDSCEIIDCLFPIWWDAPFHDLDIEIDGSPLSSMPRLTGAASAGQIRECVQVVFDACEVGRLECVVPADGQDLGRDRYFRIVPAVWSGSDVDDWENAFVTGEVQMLADHSLSWMNGKPLLFRQDQATEWLRGLRSPHLLPKPLLADPAILPQRPFATFSEAVSWLAYGEALDHRTLFARRQSEHDRVAQYAESESRPEAEAEFGLWFAAYLAELVRLEEVHRILRDAMASGDLGTDEQNGDAHLSGANLQDVQFARHELERLWGSVAGGDISGAAESEKGKSKGGALPTMNDAVASFHRQFPEGKPIDLSWSIIADRVSKDIGRKIAHENLTAALRNRGCKASNNWRYEET